MNNQNELLKKIFIEDEQIVLAQKILFLLNHMSPKEIREFLNDINSFIDRFPLNIEFIDAP